MRTTFGCLTLLIAASSVLACANGPIDIEIPGQASSVSAGQHHTCALIENGSIYCWGRNATGQLGSGTTSELEPTPVKVVSESPFVLVTSGDFHTCALTSTGVAHCWGQGAEGQLGDGSTGTARVEPVPVAGDLRFRHLDAGELVTCGVTVEGRAYCWGRNDLANLGDGTTTDRSTPTPVVTDERFERVMVGSGHGCALTAAGVAWCWGENSGGELGVEPTFDETCAGGTPCRRAPAPVPDAAFIDLAAARYHNCGILETREPACWGQGQVDPQVVPMSLSVIAISPQAFSTTAVSRKAARSSAGARTATGGWGIPRLAVVSPFRWSDHGPGPR